MANTRTAKVKVNNDKEVCRCFLCSIEIQKIESASSVDDPQEISFILSHILEVPQLEIYLERVKGQQISYCSQCSSKISKIRDVLEELEKLEKVLLDKKYEIELQFRGDSYLDQGQGQEQGSIAEIRNDIITDLRSSTIFGMMEKLKTKHIGQRSTPRTSIRIMKEVSLPRLDESGTVKVNPPENHDPPPPLPNATTVDPIVPPTVETVPIDTVNQTDHQKTNTRTSSRILSRKQKKEQENKTTCQEISRLPHRKRKQSLEFSQSSFDFFPINFVKVEEAETSDQFNLAFEDHNSVDLDEDDIDLEYHPMLLSECVMDEEEEEGIEGQYQDDANIEDMDNNVIIKVEQDGYDGLPIMTQVSEPSQNGFHVNYGELIDLTEDDDDPQDYHQHDTQGYNESMLNSEDNPTEFLCLKCGAYFDNFDLLNEHDELLHPSSPESLSEVGPSKRTIIRMRQTDMVNRKMNLANLKEPGSESSTPASTSSGSSRIRCNDCGKTFVSLTCLRNHVRHMHLGIFNFRCPVCQLGCRTRAELRLHLESHSEIRNYNCHMCQKSFKQKKNLVAHEKVHTTGPGFTCNLCGEQFWYVRDFRRHALSHKPAVRTGQGPSNGEGNVQGDPNPRPRFHDPRLKYLYNRIA